MTDNSGTNSERLRGLEGGGSQAHAVGPLPWDSAPAAPVTASSSERRSTPESTYDPASLPTIPPVVGQQPISPGPGVVHPRNGKGTASLVLGIIGMIPFPVTGFWCSLIAIILGYQGKKRARAGEAKNGSLAQAGFVLGIVGMAVQVLFGAAIAFS